MIGISVLDIWSVICVPYVAVWMKYSDHHKDCTFRTCGQCCLFRIWVVGSKIALGLHVPDTWSVFSVPYVGDGINIVIGLYVLDMWSVLFVSYAGGGI